MAKDKIDISGMNKAELLAGLYNASKPMGLGFLHATSASMTKEQAQSALSTNPRLYFDYLYGRYMKVDLSDNTLNPTLYDEVNGQGTAAKVVEQIRAGHTIASTVIIPTNVIEHLADLGYLETSGKDTDSQLFLARLVMQRNTANESKSNEKS